MAKPAAYLQLEDIQGNVLRGYRSSHALYLFVRVDDAEAGRRWLARLAGRVQHAAHWGEHGPDDAINVALTYRGLEALGVPGPWLESFPEDFRDGMAGRAERLGDRGAPADWDKGLGTGDAHVLVALNAAEEQLFEVRRQELLGEVEDTEGLSEAHQQRADILPFGREHFGFSDGLSQPAIEGDGREDPPGYGVPERRWPWQRRDRPERPLGRRSGLAWRSIKPGEIVLGYEDEDGTLPHAPAAPLGRNGTFMVYRKLAQDVPAFRELFRSAAGGDEAEAQRLAAKAVGRWPDGTPLALSPQPPESALEHDPQRTAWLNDFGYASDPLGVVCPRGAHVRRTNPRDALGWHGALSRRHRIVRRGMPYGPAAADAERDDEERGLVFICFNASIERQFEFIQAEWCTDGDVFGLGTETDLLIGGGAGRARMTIPGDARHPLRFLEAPRPLVTVKGGEYLFMPGLRALRALAAGLPGAVQGR